MEEKSLIEKIQDKRDEYYDYIIDHVKAVISASKFLMERVDVTKFAHVNIFDFENNIEHHDESKFSEDEFEPYREYYYPAEGEEVDHEEATANYKLAKQHHYANNPHHPQYYYNSSNYDIDVHEMPDVYILEMVCDWLAMSKLKTESYETIGNWYRDAMKNNKFKLALDTKKKVDLLIEVICASGNNE